MKVAFNIRKQITTVGVFSPQESDNSGPNVEQISSFTSKVEEVAPPIIPLATQRAPAAVALPFTPKQVKEEAAVPQSDPEPEKKYGLIKKVAKAPKSLPEKIPSLPEAPAPEPAKPLTLEEQALQELLKPEERREAEIAAVPLLMQSRIAGLDDIKDEDEKFRKDVESRPDVCTEAEYDSMPVDHFGEALLRGMGWEKGKSIGLNNKGLVEPIEFVRMPGERLGIGAKPPPAPPSKKIRKPGEKEDLGPMVLPTGPDGRVRHYRTLDEQLVPLRELEKKEEASKRQRREERPEEPRPNNDRDRKRERDTREPRDRSRTRSWLAQNLTVRIVSKSFQGGKYYLHKGLIVDVPLPDLAVVRLASGSTVEVGRSALETVIPPTGGTVMILKGESFHQRAKLLSKNTEQNRAQVQLMDLSLQTFSLDDLCQCG